MAVFLKMDAMLQNWCIAMVVRAPRFRCTANEPAANSPWQLTFQAALCMDGKAWIV
jgi:hypothetical protein